MIQKHFVEKSYILHNWNIIRRSLHFTSLICILCSEVFLYLKWYTCTQTLYKIHNSLNLHLMYYTSDTYHFDQQNKKGRKRRAFLDSLPYRCVLDYICTVEQILGKCFSFLFYSFIYTFMTMITNYTLCNYQIS